MNTGAPEREMCESEESIAQRSRRSQRGIGLGDPLFVNTGDSEREMCDSGESIAQRKRNRREDSVTPEF